MTTIIYKKEAYKIIGICMEVHSILGQGFSEIVYKDALELEFRNRGISFEREKMFQVIYKETILPHSFFADFVVDDKIILEIKTVSEIHDAHVKQTLNYLAVSGLDLGIVVNFREPELTYKRLVRTRNRFIKQF